MTDPAFDEVVHAPQRLRTMALLVAVAACSEVTGLRSALAQAVSANPTTIATASLRLSVTGWSKPYRS